jgi:hypothetical protein
VHGLQIGGTKQQIPTKPDTTKYRKGERRTGRYHIVRAGNPRACVADPPVDLPDGARRYARPDSSRFARKFNNSYSGCRYRRARGE